MFTNKQRGYLLIYLLIERLKGSQEPQESEEVVHPGLLVLRIQQGLACSEQRLLEHATVSTSL